MNDFLIYILKSTISISILYLVFRILMRKETFFKLNRAVLLSVVVCSAIIPLLHLPPLVQPIAQNQLIPTFQGIEIIQPVQSVPKDSEPKIVEPPAQNNTLLKDKFPWLKLLQYLYLAGILVTFLILIRSLLSVLALLHKACFVQMDGFRLLILELEVPPFSFGRFVIISQIDYDAHQQAILAHEEAHIRLNHFFDLVLLETTKAFHWFNPIIYSLIRDMKEIHEFQADQYTLNKGIDATQYQILIIQKSVGSQRFALANSFNHCQIKKRITMMNKQKTSKARRWKVATFLPLLALLLVFCGRKGGNEPPINSFQLKDQSFNIVRCEIANESFENSSKFEVRLFIEKKDDTLNDTTKEKNFVWLSISSEEVSDLAEGEYQFSSKSANDRATMTFSGAVWVEHKKMDIIEGNLICKRDSNKINITFKLKVDKENELKGTYSGSFIYASSREKTTPQYIPTPDPKPEIKADRLGLLIKFTNDGNYINNKLYSRDDFIKKVKEWMKTDVKNRGRLMFTFPDFELSDSRNIEITAISNATGISFVPTLGIDQQAVFPGGTKAMFEWIKQNIKYPIQDMAFLWSKDVVVRFVVNTKGQTINAEIDKSLNPTMDAEALRVISQMPAWKPAMKNGVPVNVEQRISIPFKFK